MIRLRPYQPLLLRILHSANATVIFAAIISGLLIYDRFDARLIDLPLPEIDLVIPLHSRIGTAMLVVFPLLALYSFHIGQRRLLQEDTISKLSGSPRPSWWYALHRLVNTMLLIAGAITLVSGRLMEASWLPLGQLNQAWYLIHLASWVTIMLSILVHILLVIKVGGLPLVLSIVSLRTRPADWRNPFHP